MLFKYRKDILFKDVILSCVEELGAICFVSVCSNFFPNDMDEKHCRWQFGC